jgi:hypothetical protein
MTATAGTHAFTASTEDRRRCTCGKSRNTTAHGYDAKARKEEARRVEAITAQAAEDATVAEAIAAAVPAVLELTPAELTPAELAAKVAAEAEDEGRYADAGEARATALAEAVTAGTLTFDAAVAHLLGGAPVTLTAPLAVVTVDGEETTVEAAPTDVRAATDAAWTAALAAPPAEKAPAKKRKPETERMTSLWVARNMVEGLIARAADADPAVASIAAKVDASVPNNRGGRTIRLTKADLLALSAIATEVENAATEAAEGTVAMSARKLHARLDGYLATY